MSSIDESSEVMYITVQALSNSQTNSNPKLAIISQQSNAILDNLQNYNVYVQSLTFNSQNIPYCNFRRNIGWNATNFQNNKTNYSISIMAQSGYPFTIQDADNALLVGINKNGTSNQYQGITCFLQFFSEDSTFPNPNQNGHINTGYNSQGYGREYFNLTDLDHLMNMINNAINTIVSCLSGNILSQNTLYFSYNPSNQLFQLTMPSVFYSGGYDIYVNTFLQRILDGFRWIYHNNSDVSSASYTGLDYKLSKYNYPSNLNNNVWTYTAKYSTICNIVDIHSILLVANGGDLNNISQSYIPSNTQFNGYIPSLSVLKALDFDYSSFNLNQVNNCFVQYEATGLFFPLNTTGKGNLRDIQISLYAQDNDNSIYPIQIPAGFGYVNLRLALKKKLK